MPEISIIIPFNNVEDYIAECLESVRGQTFSDIEIILINDASSDKSRETAQEFLNKDSRFKIIDLKERRGQGYARNRGIEAASGRYIGFTDSDDFIEPDMYERLYNAAKKDDTDITMCCAAEFDDTNKTSIVSDYYSLSVLGKFEDKVFCAEDTKNEILDINVSLWNKIYKSSYLLNTGEKFPEGFIYEDLPFFYGSYLPASKINIVWKTLYNYRINRKNSTMMQFNNKILDRPPMVSLAYEKMKAFSFLDDIKPKIQGWIINDLFHRYTLLKENYNREFFFLMKKVFQSLDAKDMDDALKQSVYHFRGYELVINNTYEDFSRKMFKEYLDIHEVENRLRCEISSYKNLDSRFNHIYEDLNKNYKYTEELCSRIKNELKQEIKEAAENIEKEMETGLKPEYKIMSTDIKDLSYILNDNYKTLQEENALLKAELAALKLEIERIKTGA